ncbi:dihydrofolate reductase [Aeromicrobium terrae]|uniref:Dihydrofolate reductase n=1 Tax=Aeromicrobium terrae TaxID=2498846 RepID=A0A5C8NQ80_9ACTN|nr:dihydrofolate reductase [Aeromicrobium terrae]TXL63286.1 dihydrofolate reductase [Aeromicrobium terrae]
MTVTLVVAMGSNGVIGVDNALPWRLPEDLAHFKQLTLGHPMIMGRTTFESIGRPLPGRTTIVLTRDASWSAEGVETAPDLDAALARAQELDDDVFVVGGGQVYAEALERDLVDLLCVTRVAQSPDGDTRFPAVDWERWRPVGSIQHDGFEIVTYERG